VALLLPGSVQLPSARYSRGEGSRWLWPTWGFWERVAGIGPLRDHDMGKGKNPAPFQWKIKSLWKRAFPCLQIDLKNGTLRFALVHGFKVVVFAAFTTVQQFALFFFKDVVGVADPAAASFRPWLFQSSACSPEPTRQAGFRPGRTKAHRLLCCLLGAFGILLILVLPKDVNILLIPAL